MFDNTSSYVRVYGIQHGDTSITHAPLLYLVMYTTASIMITIGQEGGGATIATQVV